MNSALQFVVPLASPDLREIMFQRFNHSGAMHSAGDETTVSGDFLPDFKHRVCRASGHSGVVGIEHFHVIVAIAHCETPRWRQLVEPRDFAEAAALLKIPMAEAQIDRIPLP
jgi:hypothetical protein